MPATLLAGTAFVLVQKTAILSAHGDEEEKENQEDVAHQYQEVESIRYRDSNERFRGISDAFSSLSLIIPLAS